MNSKDLTAQALKDDLSFRNIFTIINSNQDNIAAEYLDTRKIRQITYAQYEKYIKSAAYQIRQILGDEYKEGFVGLKLDNCPQWPIAFWGILMAGYKPLLLDFRLDDRTTNGLLAESEAIAIIVGRNEKFFSLVNIIPAETLWETELEVPADWKFAWADEIALCTSGTTSAARIFVYNGYAMSHSILNLYEAYKLNPIMMPEGEARLLAFVPYHHIYGFIVSYLSSSIIGKTIIYLKDRAPSTILQACHIHKVTHIYGIPLLWNNIASGIMKEVAQTTKTKQCMFKLLCDISLTAQKIFPKSAEKLTRMMFAGLHNKLLGQEIILLGCGGGSVLPQTLKILNAIGYNLICGYGMTEVGITSFDAGNDIEKKLTASLGQALGDCEYKIIPANAMDDPDTGELYIKSASLHTARIADGVYLPPLSDEYGWFATGDIATIKNGTMWMKGRLKEVIINESGENVYPDELEDLFSSIKSVEQLCVLGVKNGPYEDITLILYCMDNDKKLQPQMIQEIYRINRRLPVFKRLNRVLLSHVPLPITNTMKVQRLKLKEQIENNTWPYVMLDINHFADNDEILTGEDNYLGDVEGLSENNFVSIKRWVKQCFADILNIPLDIIHDDSHFIDDLGGDSLLSLELLAKLEEKYAIAITDDEFFQCNNVNELSLLIYGIIQSTVKAGSKDNSGVSE